VRQTEGGQRGELLQLRQLTAEALAVDGALHARDDLRLAVHAVGELPEVPPHPGRRRRRKGGQGQAGWAAQLTDQVRPDKVLRQLRQIRTPN